MLNLSNSYIDHHRRQHWKALNVTAGDPPYKDVKDFFFQAEQKKVQSTAVDFSQLSLELSTRSAAAVSDIFFNLRADIFYR